MIRLVVPGRPVPAVRMTQRSKFTSNQAGRYLAYKNQIGWVAKAARVQQTAAPVEVSAIVYLCGGHEGDVDNYGKAMLDSLNGIAWKDDRQVRKLTVEKRQAQSAAEERAEIEIKEIA